MKKIVWFLAFFVVFTAAMPMAVESIRAADCEAILAQAKGERRLLKRRKILREAIKSCPQHAEINFQYGYILERLREYEDALQYYQNAVRLNTRAAKYYFGLGDVYKVLGNKAAAIDAYGKGLRFDPENERAQNTLATLRGVPKPKTVTKAAVTPPAPPKVEPKPPAKLVKPEPVKVAKVEEKQKVATSVQKAKTEPVEKGKKAVKPKTPSKVQKEQKPERPQAAAKVAKKPETVKPAKTVQKAKAPAKMKTPAKKVAAKPKPAAKPPVKVAKKKVIKPPVPPIKPTQVKQAKASPVQTTTKPKKVATVKKKPVPAKAVESKPQPKPVVVASVKRGPPIQLQGPMPNSADLFSQQQDERVNKFSQFLRSESQRKARFRKLAVPRKTSDTEDQKQIASRRAENKKNEAIDEFKIDPSRPIIVYYGPDRKVPSRK